MATITGYIYYFAEGDTLHVPSGYLYIVSCDISGDSQIPLHVGTKMCVSVCACMYYRMYVHKRA